MIRADLDRFLDEAMGQESWALVRLRDSDTVTVLGGPLVPASLLKDIELPEGPPALGRRFDHLAAVPFRADHSTRLRGPRRRYPVGGHARRGRA